jgi:hypothetical protein
MKLVPLATLAALLLCSAAAPLLAQEAVDLARIEKGQDIYKSRDYECDSCHGWAGRGKPADHPFGNTVDGNTLEYGGNALTHSPLTRDEMIMLISCGRIVYDVNIMPQYRGDAWTASYPCWGKVAADVPANQRPLRGPGRMMTPAEIELVVDYVQHVYQGKDMTWEWCRKYFDDFLRVCEVWAEHGIQ